MLTLREIHIYALLQYIPSSKSCYPIRNVFQQNKTDYCEQVSTTTRHVHPRKQASNAAEGSNCVLVYINGDVCMSVCLCTSVCLYHHSSQTCGWISLKLA